MTENTLNSSHEEMIKTIQQQNMTLEKKIDSLKRISILKDSLVVSTVLVVPIVVANWAVISAALVTAAPIIGIVAASLGAMVAVISLSALVYKNRTAIKESAEKALKNTKDGIVYAAERTVDRAGLLAKKTVDGAVYIKNQAQDAAAKVTEGIGSTFKKIGKGIEKTGRKLIDAGQNVKDTGNNISRSGSFKLTSRIITEEEIKKFNDVKASLQKELSQSKNKKDTAQVILAEIASVIDEKMKNLNGKEDYTGKDLDSSGKLQMQKEYIEGLNHKILQKELSSKKIDPQLCEIFSQHSDEIKRIIEKFEGKQTENAVSKSCGVDDSTDRLIDKAVKQNPNQNTSSQPKTVAPQKPPRSNPALLNVQNRSSDDSSSISSGDISNDNKPSFEAELLKIMNEQFSNFDRSGSVDSLTSNNKSSRNFSSDSFSRIGSATSSRSNSFLDSGVSSSDDRNSDDHSHSNLVTSQDDLNNSMSELNERMRALAALTRKITSPSSSSSVDSVTTCKRFTSNTQPGLLHSNSLYNGVATSDHRNDSIISNVHGIKGELNNLMSELKDLQKEVTTHSEQPEIVDSTGGFKSCNSGENLTRSSSFGSFKNGFSPEQLEVKKILENAGHKVEFPKTKEIDSGVGSSVPSSCSSDEDLVRSSSSDSSKTKVTRSASCNNLNDASQDFSRSRSSSLSSVSSVTGLPRQIIFTEKDGRMKSQADLRKTGSLEKLVGSQIELNAANSVTPLSVKQK